MATCHFTTFYDNRDLQRELVAIYRVYDGRPICYGTELKNLLAYVVFPKNAKDLNCLAAQVVAHFKKGMSDVFLYPGGSRGLDEEFVYILSYGKNNMVHLTLECRVSPKRYEVVYDGLIKDMDIGAVELEVSKVKNPLDKSQRKKKIKVFSFIRD